MWNKALICIVTLVATSSCGIINIRKTGADADAYANYTEDISDSRIQFADLPKSSSSIDESGIVAAVDSDLDEAIRNYIREKEEDRYFNGFTILVYSGVDREMAFETRNELYSEFPDIQAEMQYQQPRYLVKVGKYINRIEALAQYEKIKEEFPSSRIIQDRFQMDRGSQNEEKLDDTEK